MLSRFERKTLIKILIAVDILLVLITAFICFFQSERVKRIYSQQAAERWESKDNPYSEVSVFYSEAHKAGKKDVEELRNSIMKKLTEDGLLDVSNLSGRRVFIDAYSGFENMLVERENVQLTGKIYGVSDDFFLVHPIPLLNGNYINPTEKASDIGNGIDPFQIIMDENMAWHIFGSVNVEGMKVWINGRVFTVMGVVEASQNKTEEMAYGNYDAAFIPYSAFKLMEQEVYVNCYEAVLPEPIKGYAVSAMGEAADIVVDQEEEASGSEVRSTLSFGDKELVENTDRFGIPSLWKYLKNKKYMSMKTTEIAYPYWENIARFEVERAAGIFKVCCFLLLLPVLSVLALLGWLYHKRTVVFNSKNKEKVMDLLAELGEGIKDHFTKPTVENYDDDPEDDEDDENPNEVSTYGAGPSGVNPNAVNPSGINPDEEASGGKKKKFKKNKKEKKPSAEDQIRARVAQREAEEAEQREAEEAARREAEEAAQREVEEAARREAEEAAQREAEEAARREAEEAEVREAEEDVQREASEEKEEIQAESQAASSEESDEDFELTTVDTVVEEPEDELKDQEDSEEI